MRSLFSPTIFLGAALALLVTIFAAPSAHAAQSSAQPLTFHFYGALNCPPCMAFKRNHLAGVEQAGKELGFKVVANVIARTSDVATVGSFGATDPILRKAAPQLRYVYPPIFFVSRGDEIVSVHNGDWQGAFDAVKTKAAQVSG